MQKRHIVYNIQGMGQDVVSSPQNTNMAYSIKNMRLTPTKDSNALELTTERGTQLINIEEDSFPDNATVIGYCTLQEYLVLFIKADEITSPSHKGPDYIFRLEQIDTNGDGIFDSYESVCLFDGRLNFDIDSHIEATACFENENVQKIYWVDGVNQPRMINIVGQSVHMTNSNVYTGYDFLQKVLKTNSAAKIKAKKLYTSGIFTSGVIQYAYSLYNLNQQETPIIDTTSLLYITQYNRGGSPNEQCSCSFEINIENKYLENKFQYIRVYSIQRNSLNGTPLAKVIADIPFSENVTIIDDGNIGYDIDYNQLQYQRLPIRPLTITQKDRVLFVGNYTTDIMISELTHLYEKSEYQLPITTSNWWQGVADEQYQVNVYNPNDTGVYPWSNQLDTESAGVKTFKYNETYKLGVQFQDRYGNWSQPYFIRDVKQDKYPIVDNLGLLRKPIFSCSINAIYNSLNNKEKQTYVKIRPVVSLPSVTERSVLCQGVLNPTVFNITDRCDKSCYAQSSWFFRPLLPTSSYEGFDSNDTYGSQPYGAVLNYKHYESLHDSMDIGGEIQGMYYDPEATNPYADPTNCRSYFPIESENYDPERYRNFFYTDWSVLTFNSADIEFNNSYKTLGLHSYNLKLDGIIPLDNAFGNYRLISQSPYCFMDRFSAIDAWNHSTAMRSANMPNGFFNYPLSNGYNVNVDGRGILCAQNSWFDDASAIIMYYQHPIPAFGDGTYWNGKNAQISYYIYPWQRQYLNNYSGGMDQLGSQSGDEKDGVFPDYEAGKITSKVLSNIRYSLQPLYFGKTFDINHQELYTCSNDSLIRLSGIKLYKPSINKYHSYNTKYYGSHVSMNENGLSNSIVYLTTMDNNNYGYPITVQGLPESSNALSGTGRNFSSLEDNTNFSRRINVSKPREFMCPKVSDGTYQTRYEFESGNNHWVDRLISANGRSDDPILIAYKSAPHIVFQMDKYSDTDYQLLLPALTKSLYDSTPYTPSGTTQYYYRHTYSSGYDLPWSDSNYDDNMVGSMQQYFTSTHLPDLTNNKAYLMMASLYTSNYNNPDSTYLNTWNTDDIDHPYLENESNLYLRNWIPCGKTQPLYGFVGDITVDWIEGDTYYQRYDCVKTKPYDESDYQSVIEILSFLIESNINLDGRYDKNRGILDYTIISDENFNLFNDVYNQENNFFTYFILDPEKFDISEFRNDIVWSARKVAGESIDQWTKLSSINQLQLDGNKGHVKALRKFNDNIYCFQDHATSRIRFNDRTAIATESGEPLQLAHTNYVDGYEYVNGDIGCQYGISCCETENGIFFIDNDIPGIYKLSYNEYGNVNIKNITKERLMQRWFENIGNVNKTRMFFDKPVNEILTLNSKTLQSNNNGYCLSFSCDMNAFQQFIDYENAQYVFTHNNWPVAVTNINGDIELWKLRNGSFASFFGQYRRPYGLKFVASPPRTNEGLVVDCIYDNLSYKADVFVGPNGDDVNLGSYSYQPNESFDSINVYSMYQDGNEQLSYTDQPHHQISNLRKKFGVWFARIPRFSDISQPQGRYNKERMRGSKLMIDLMKNQPSVTNSKLVLKELSVDCFY